MLKMLKDQVDSNDVNLVNYNLCRSGVLWAEIGVVFFSTSHEKRIIRHTKLAPTLLMKEP